MGRREQNDRGSRRVNIPPVTESTSDPIAQVPFLKCMIESCDNDRIQGDTVCVEHDARRRQ